MRFLCRCAAIGSIATLFVGWFVMATARHFYSIGTVGGLDFLRVSLLLGLVGAVGGMLISVAGRRR